MERLTTKGYEYCSCDFMEDGIYEMANKLSSYEDVGTPEECREAVDKQNPIHARMVISNKVGECPKCSYVVFKWYDSDMSYCCKCGQAIDWSDE